MSMRIRELADQLYVVLAQFVDDAEPCTHSVVETQKCRICRGTKAVDDFFEWKEARDLRLKKKAAKTPAG